MGKLKKRKGTWEGSTRKGEAALPVFRPSHYLLRRDDSRKSQEATGYEAGNFVISVGRCCLKALEKQN